MAFRVPGLSGRFFVALVVLLLALAAVSVVGFVSLQRVQGANDQVFSDNFRTAEATSRLNADLSTAEKLGLEIAAARDTASADRLRAQLNQIVAPQVAADIATVVAHHGRDAPAERAQVARIPAVCPALARAGQTGLAADRGVLSDAARARAVTALTGALDPLLASVAARESTELDVATAAHAGARATYHRSRTWLIVAGIVALIAALAMVRIGLALKQLVDQQSAEQLHGESEGEYIETLQVTENEDEAQELLRRQVERSLPDARAVVLTRNNSDDRLEPKTSLAELDALREPLVGATPRSCLAVRFGRSHAEGDESAPLMRCEVCGKLPGTSTCEPLLVGGEVIGAVLINHDRSPSERARQRSREAVAQAAPVLANLRNLALAELRAATDALTGLPNQRAVQDTLKRMVAQASRSISPLAALLVDLDHFKEINDVYGHDRGDEVLAAVGVAFRNVVRESDFVGRYGGEEFLLLLPATDKSGALQLAEAIRSAIASIQLPGVDRLITASVGVAVLPDDGGDAVTLFRSADRALYAAKSNGRNRIETAVSGEQHQVAAGV